ncbi:MAG: prolipoprotein diacylglyceryl transferase [Spirochaetaceae bacterium]|nr:MAG: prolipoprotein diacylglyceryl transferase [Spirochaetaceae bacterium]
MSYLTYPTWLTPEVIPGLPVRWYGLMYLVAFATTYALVRVQIRKRGLDASVDDTMNMGFWMIIGLLLGARLLSALLYQPDMMYWQRPWLIFWPFQNGRFTGLVGMSYHGGLIGAVVGGVLYCIRRGWHIREWADIVTVSVPLGYTFGRLGNFLNAELYGRVTTAPFGMVFPTAPRFPAHEAWVAETAQEVGIAITDPGMMVNLPRHASQLYQAALEGVILWAILWFLIAPRARRTGVVTAAYIIGYGLARFIGEYFRQPDADLGFVLSFSGDPGPVYLLNSYIDFSMGQVLSAIMIAAGIAVLFAVRKVPGRQEQIPSYSPPAKTRSPNNRNRAKRARRKN